MTYPTGYPTAESNFQFHSDLPNVTSRNRVFIATTLVEYDAVMQPNLLYGSPPGTLGESKSPTIVQNLGILEVCGENGFNSEAIHFMVNLSRLVNRYVGTDSEVVRSQARRYITSMYQDVSDRSKVAYIDGLGYAYGAALLEQQTTLLWRDKVEERINGLDADEAEKAIVHAALTETPIPNADPQTVKEVLMRTPLLDVDVSMLRQTMDHYDIESLVGKAAELIDYFQTRYSRAENPSETWLMCEKALSYYAPFLYLCGYATMASELQGLAYEFFYEDNAVIKRTAEEQWERSQKYQPIVNELVQDSLVGLSDESDIVGYRSRVKSKGSLEKKLTDEHAEAGIYVEASTDLLIDQVSDGIASRIILTDNAFNESNAVSYAEKFKTQIADVCLSRGYELIPWHHSGEDERNYVNDPKPGTGYQAYHLNYMLVMPGPNGFSVPFEIQIVNQSMHFENTHGNRSHVVVYKTPDKQRIISSEGNSITSDQRTMLGHFALRAMHLDIDQGHIEDIYSIHSALNPSTIAHILREFPDLPTPLHEVYTVNQFGDIVPKSLVGVEIPPEHRPTPEKMYLPPVSLTHEQFNFLISFLDRSYGSDAEIQAAIDWVSELEATDPKAHSRRNGTSVVEGHLLPVAFYGALLDTVSGRRWEHQADEVQRTRATIIALLLHNVIEDHFSDDQEVGLDMIRKKFNGTAYTSEAAVDEIDIAAIVEGVTLPDETDEHLRRLKYAAQFSVDHGISPLLYYEIADRMHNHTSDLKQLISGDLDDKTRTEIEKYFLKTDTYFAALFDSVSQYPVYANLRAYIWALRDSVVNHQAESV